MDISDSNLQKIGCVIRRLPLWLKIIIVINIISVIISGPIWIITIIREIVTGESFVRLKDFKSKYYGYQIKVPQGWMPYESKNGINGDTDLILQSMESGFNRSVLDISRIEKKDADLSQIVNWDRDRAMKLPETSIDSISPYNTSAYPGILLIYNLFDAGFEKTDFKCRDWVTYCEPYGYVIRLCTAPDNWVRLESPFQEIVGSFSLK